MNESGSINISFIEPTGRQHRVLVDAGVTLMHAAVDNGIAGIDAICGGACSCATCHVYVDAPWFSLVGAAQGAERELLSCMDEMREESRLGCQITIGPHLDGLTVRVAAGV